jgi:HSP20 family protein
MSWLEISSPFARPAHGGPLDALERLRREVDDLFSRAAPRVSTGAAGVLPAINLYENAEGLVLTAELPGMKLEELELSLDGQRLTLGGERRIAQPEGERTSFHRRERRPGKFRRTIELPREVDAEKIQASYRDGVLTVRLPRAASTAPRRIEVTSG